MRLPARQLGLPAQVCHRDLHQRRSLDMGMGMSRHLDTSCACRRHAGQYVMCLWPSTGERGAGQQAVHEHIAVGRPLNLGILIEAAKRVVQFEAAPLDLRMQH